MSPDAYVHAPLVDAGKRIRLLLLQGGDGEQPIHCAVSHWFLDEAPPFSAISYTWGHPEDDEKNIFLDGKDFIVCENCHRVLCQLRHNFPDTYIWIDAICINQSDSIEKSAQVNITGQVYEKSSTVVACIGPQDGASSRVEPYFKAVENDMSHLLRASDGSWMRFAGNSGLQRHQLEEGMSWLKRHVDDTGDDLLALFRQYELFMQRPYWTRLWILQEVHAGLTIESLSVICGFSVWKWAVLRTFNEILGRTMFATFYDKDPDLPGLECALGIGSYSAMLNLTPKRRTIHEAISWFPYFGCSDPRDKIYGLLNTVHWREDRSRIMPDYAKDSFGVIMDLLDHFAGDGMMWWMTDFQRLLEGLEINVQHGRIQDLLQTPQGEVMPDTRRIDLCVSGTKARILCRHGDGGLWANMDPKQPKTNNSSVLAYIPDTSTTASLPSLDDIVKDPNIPTACKIFRSASAFDIIAIATPHARAGDLLVQIQLYSNIAVILRHHGNDRFDLVGWSVLSDTYKLDGTDLRVAPDSEGWDNMYLRLQVTKEQAVALGVLAYDNSAPEQLITRIVNVTPTGPLMIDEWVGENKTAVGDEAKTAPLYPSLSSTSRT